MALSERAEAGAHLQPIQPDLGCAISILLKAESALPFLPTSPPLPAVSTAQDSGPLGQILASGHRAWEAAVQWLLSPEPSPCGAKFPPAMWNYEPGTVVRPHRVCFPQAALAEFTTLPGESKQTSVHFVRNQQGAFLDLA